MEEVMQVVQSSVMTILGTILLVFMRIAAKEVKRIVNDWADTQAKKDLANTTVAYVEQVFKDAHGSEKLDVAKDKFLEALKEKGINISETEMDMLLESAVKGMNEGLGK